MAFRNTVTCRVPALNPYDYMNENHINLIWDELEERFGFPKKQWKLAFKKHLDKQPKSEQDISVFLRYGHDHIQPILNGILLRSDYFPTFEKFVEYVIRKSPEFEFELKRMKRH